MDSLKSGHLLYTAWTLCLVPLQCKHALKSGHLPIQDTLFRSQRCPHFEVPLYFVLFSGCTEGDARLTGGNNRREGQVEICRNNMWGTSVCSGYWGAADAMVVCRELGLSTIGKMKQLSFLLAIRDYDFYNGQGRGARYLEVQDCEVSGYIYTELKINSHILQNLLCMCRSQIILLYPNDDLA